MCLVFEEQIAPFQFQSEKNENSTDAGRARTLEALLALQAKLPK